MKEFTCYKKKSDSMSLEFDLTEEMIDYINERLMQYTFVYKDTPIQVTYDEVYKILKDPEDELGSRTIGIIGHLQLTLLGAKIENLIGDYLIQQNGKEIWTPEREVEWSDVIYNG